MRDIGEMVMVAGFSFLLGFKIAAHLGRRHLERMQAIWRQTSNAKRSLHE